MKNWGSTYLLSKNPNYRHMNETTNKTFHSWIKFRYVRTIFRSLHCLFIRTNEVLCNRNEINLTRHIRTIETYNHLLFPWPKTNLIHDAYMDEGESSFKYSNVSFLFALILRVSPLGIVYDSHPRNSFVIIFKKWKRGCNKCYF